MPLTWLLFFVAAFACYRVTILIARDAGPSFGVFKGGIFKWLRSQAHSSKLLSCPFCVSVYIGALTAFGLWFAGIRFGGDERAWPLWVMLGLAFSAITIFADRTWTADYQG